MSDTKWEIGIAVALVALSTVLYYIHFLIFHDIHHISIYLLGDIAFTPIEVLIVTLILHRLLEHRDKKQTLEKLNMVIGSFFSEVGEELLTYFSDNDPDLKEIRKNLIVNNNWDDREFKNAHKILKNYNYHVKINSDNIKELKEFLNSESPFILRLMENPALLEHEKFTGLLRAISHLSEELMKRKDIDNLPQSDIDHISGDIVRVYERLVSEWLDYMMYLKNNYPYLFSLAMRSNPFDLTSEIIVK
ncbi:hypothetical protein [Methanococcus maripaludis]|uniref:Uncharacterized protein n=2 Tax=Methanococcus maripaludis TaxID=39152 RepID=A0A7J9NW66_METMI|nr:hypothetical protein [Methanococcus maripaludis]MDK2929283.1 hypothetical protein [Methanococcus sp.]AEK18976.1 hypothetical protein GYY_00430 [Methanococcus maripaludis X1]MBA2845874.1 hypothetical protein [Methanococcus maripaludis]MBA2851930.1 hypothetical protein [Methanococcus maripaludis]MBA2859118.1 hypothetical protein [Methanococcus maripaludis]